MKRTLIALLTASVLLAGSNAFAAATATVDISATVVASCQFWSNDIFTFPALDPTSGLSPSATQSVVTFSCTNNEPYTIQDDGGLTTGYLLDNGAGATIGYNFAYTATGTGTGAVTPLSVTVDIPYANYQTKPAGTYADTVTLSFLP